MAAKTRKLSLARVSKGDDSRCSLPSLPSTPSTSASSSASPPTSPTSPLSPLSPLSGSLRTELPPRRTSASLGKLGRSKTQLLPPASAAASSGRVDVGIVTSTLTRQSQASYHVPALSGMSRSENDRFDPRTRAGEGLELWGVAPSSGLHLSDVWRVNERQLQVVDPCIASEVGYIGERSMSSGGIRKANCWLLDLLAARSGLCASILAFLQLQTVVAFHLASPSCLKHCRSSSSKLLVPVFVFKRKWLRHVDLPSVKALYADDAHLITMAENEDFANWLSECISLRSLYCSHNGNLDVPVFARTLTCLPRLEVLDISHNRLAVDDRFSFKRARPLGSLFAAFSVHLRVLDLSYNLLRDEDAHQLVEALEARALAGGSNLEELAVRSNYLGNGAGFAFGHFMRSPYGAALWRLDMRTNQVEEDGACAMLEALKSHPAMKEIRIGYNRQNTRQDLETAALACLLLTKTLASAGSKLAVLDLNNVRIGDLGITRMANALKRNLALQRLDLAFNSIGEEGAEALATALTSNRSLEYMDLRDNEVGDVGAQALALALQDNFTFKQLKIARNGINFRGAMALRSALHENPRLKIEFGSSGGQLDGLVRRTPRMADLQFMREAYSTIRERDSADARGGEISHLVGSMMQ